MNIEDLLTKAEGDYPDISNVTGTEKDIVLLSKAFSGCLSETTAVLQYIFQHYITKDKKVAEIFKRISMCEMHHHSILGEIIVSLGGTPYYTNGHGGDFSTQCVYEGKDLLEILKQNIKDEQGAIDHYENIKKQLSNNLLVEVVDRIILDELAHIDTFTKLIEYVTFYKDK